MKLIFIVVIFGPHRTNVLICNGSILFQKVGLIQGKFSYLYLAYSKIFLILYSSIFNRDFITCIRITFLSWIFSNNTIILHSKLADTWPTKNINRSVDLSMQIVKFKTRGRQRSINQDADSSFDTPNSKKHESRRRFYTVWIITYYDWNSCHVHFCSKFLHFLLVK